MKVYVIGLIIIGLFIWGLSAIPLESPSIENPPANSSEPQPPTALINEAETEKETWRLINKARQKEGIAPTEWDDELYSLSKAHTEKMAAEGDIFHSPKTADFAENCWGGRGKCRNYVNHNFTVCYKPSII